MHSIIFRTNPGASLPPPSADDGRWWTKEDVGRKLKFTVTEAGHAFRTVCNPVCFSHCDREGVGRELFDEHSSETGSEAHPIGPAKLPSTMETDSQQNSANGSTDCSDASDIAQLRRFLCYGSTRERYDCTEEVETKEELKKHCAFLGGLIDKHQEEVVREICAARRKNVRENPILFTLAVCVRKSAGKEHLTPEEHATRVAAFKAVIDVCETPAQLFQFVAFCEDVGEKGTGWGRGQRRAISEWYKNMASKDKGMVLAEAMTRCVSKNGWTHQDVIRLAHVKFPRTDDSKCLFTVAHNQDNAGNSLQVLSLFAALPVAHTVWICSA